MQPGDVTDVPIKYAGNWYILRRGDSVPKTFEEAKQELLVSLRNRRGYEAAFKLAIKAQKRLKESKDPQKVAQELSTEANMTPAEMIRQTQYVKPGDDIPNIGSNQQFEATLAPLNNKDDVGEPTGIKGGFAIPLLVDKKEPRLPDFDEVKTKVADAVKQQRAGEQIEQKAKELAASVNAADALKAAGEKAGFEAATEEGFKLGSSLGKAGSSTALDELIYGLKPGETTKAPIKVAGNWVVLGITKRGDADLASFATQRDQLKETMLGERQNQVFGDYVAAVQERMKREGKIKIYDDVLASMEQDEPAASTLPPGLNFPTK
jgi:parvulin-like peptidyl-prolyl isomerase